MIRFGWSSNLFFNSTRIRPSMPPRTSDDKAIKIMEAAGHVLANKGYMGTTINAVAQQAGVSRGLLHYYFKNKEDMLAKVLKKNMEISTQMIARIFQAPGDAAEYAREITELLRGIMTRDPDFFHLFFEGYAVARHSTVVREELSNMYGQFRKALESGLVEAADQGFIRPDMPAAPLAAVITGLLDGMGLQLLTEPDLADCPDIWVGLEQSIMGLLMS